MGRGGKLVTNKNEEIVYKPNLIVVKELLESEDPVKYLGIYFYVLNNCTWLRL